MKLLLHFLKFTLLIDATNYLVDIQLEAHITKLFMIYEANLRSLSDYC